MRTIVLCLALTCLIGLVVAIISKPVEHTPHPVMVVHTAADSSPYVPPLPPTGGDSAKTITMPEPIVITNRFDIDRISDAKLRAWVRKRANFNQDRVLYFEWKGGAKDKLTSVFNPVTSQYIVTFHSCPMMANPTIHRQVFVLPASYAYKVEMAK